MLANAFRDRRVPSFYVVVSSNTRIVDLPRIYVVQPVLSHVLKQLVHIWVELSEVRYQTCKRMFYLATRQKG